MKINTLRYRLSSFNWTLSFWITHALPRATLQLLILILVLLLIGKDGKLHTPFRKNVTFQCSILKTFRSWWAIFYFSSVYIVFISQLMHYARDCLAYECFFWGPLDFRISFSSRHKYVVECLKSSLRKFYGRYGDRIKQYDVPLSRDIWSCPFLELHMLFCRDHSLRTFSCISGLNFEHPFLQLSLELITVQFGYSTPCKSLTWLMKNGNQC